MSYSNIISNTVCDEHRVPIQQCGCTSHVYAKEVGYKRIPKRDDCDPCGADYEKVENIVEVTPIQYSIPCASPTGSCVEPEVGVSSPNGLYSQFQWGLGVEHKVKLPGSNQNSGHNLIPWYGIDWSFADSSLPFAPRIIEDCSGTVRSEKDRTTLQVIGPDGKVIKEFKAPSLGLGGGGAITYRLIDNNPLVDSTVTVPSGTPTVIEAGTGIDIVPRADGFRIVNSALATPVKIVSIPGSGVTVTGGQVITDTDGIAKQTFTVGIDCGSLRTQCGLVKSVNNITPDSNGNINIQTSGGSGITGVTTPDGSVSITYPTAGTVGLAVNQDVLAQNFIRKPGNGLLNQVLVSNGDGTYRWADLCALITQLGCFGSGGGGGVTPGTVGQPGNARIGQSVVNGGTADGNTTYSCGDPLLAWNASSSAGATYEIKEGSTIIATNLTALTYQLSGVTLGNHSYTIVAKVGTNTSNPSSLATVVAACGTSGIAAIVGDNRGDAWKIFIDGTFQRVLNYSSGVIKGLTRDSLGNVFASNEALAGVGTGDGAIALIPNTGAANTSFTTNLSSPTKMSRVVSGFFYVASRYGATTLTKVNALTGQASAITIPGAVNYPDPLYGGDVDTDSSGNAYFSWATSNAGGTATAITISKVTSAGVVSNLGTFTRTAPLTAINNNVVLVLADGTVISNDQNTVFKVTPGGVVSTLFTLSGGDTVINSMSTDGSNVYVSANSNVYKVVVSTGVSSVFLNGRSYFLAKYFSVDGNLYATEYNTTGYRVIKITPAGVWSQVNPALIENGVPFSIISV